MYSACVDVHGSLAVDTPSTDLWLSRTVVQGCLWPRSHAVEARFRPRKPSRARASPVHIHGPSGLSLNGVAPILAATRPHGLLDGARALETASPRRGSCDWPTVGGLLLPRPPCRVPRPRLRLPTALQGPSRQKHGSRKTITSTPQCPSATACIPSPAGGGAPPRRSARGQRPRAAEGSAENGMQKAVEKSAELIQVTLISTMIQVTLIITSILC
jgi:hypothetical protein